jgi:hypothetical protein
MLINHIQQCCVTVYGGSYGVGVTILWDPSRTGLKTF